MSENDFRATEQTGGKEEQSVGLGQCSAEGLQERELGALGSTEGIHRN